MTKCPTPQEIEQLLFGDLPEEWGNAFEVHMTQCPRCREVLDGMRVNSRLTEVFTGDSRPGGVALSDNARKMMDRAEQLATQLSSLGSDPSFSSLGTSDNDGSEASGFPFLSPPERPGDLGRLAHYRVIRLLGRGGMGRVFLAEDQQLHRQVALKVMRSKYAKRPEARERFLREARAMAAIKHDNVAAVYEVSEWETGRAGDGESDEAGAPLSFPFLAMELLEGESLAAYLKRHPRPAIEMIVRVGRQAAAGLAAAHARGVIHRDIKPGNLWLEVRDGVKGRGGDGETGRQGGGVKNEYIAPSPALPVSPSRFRLKILDFGLVHPIEEGRQSESTQAAGTPGYMAPEQVRGETLDTRCDLFALGCVLYQLCTGGLPFPIELEKIRERTFDYPSPRPISKVNPTIPDALANLVHRLLSINPDDRLQSAEEVERRLERIERRLWFLRQPRWVRWAGAATILFLVGTAVYGLGPSVWNIVNYGGSARQPVIVSDVGQGDEITFPRGAPDEAWRRLVQNLPAQQQVNAVAAKLFELNPGFEGVFTRVGIEGGRIVELSFSSQHVSDIRPLQALASLRNLYCVGNQFYPGQVADLSPLKDLPLQRLDVKDNHAISDLRPLAQMKLVALDISGTTVDSLEAVDGANLEELGISYTQIRDLSPVRNMPRLRKLTCYYCPLESLEPLLATNLRELNFSFRQDRHREILKRLDLETINHWPARDFGRRPGVGPR